MYFTCPLLNIQNKEIFLKSPVGIDGIGTFFVFLKSGIR
jgi:hypothetical protein